MSKYNLVIITPDQLRADYVGCYGNTKIKTPNIDDLSRKGVKFENMYCAAPLCGPSRCSFATSTYFSEHNHRNYDSTISPDVPNIAMALKNEGYRTGMFGKNHLFTYERLGEVWESFYEKCLGNYDGHPEFIHSYSSFTLDENHEYNITGKLTEQGVEFIKSKDERPFFLWLNYQDPHPAFCCPPPYDTMYNPKDVILSKKTYGYDEENQPMRNHAFRVHSEMNKCTTEELKEAIAHYMGQVTYVDDSVGRIMETLQETKNNKSTVVLFFSDHGELLGDYGMTHKNPTFYDCLTRIPAILVHPDGRWKESVFSGLTEEVDLVPTILEMLDIEIPPTMVGKSWVSDLDVGETKGKENIICEAGGGCPTCIEPIKGFVQNAPHAPTSFGVGSMIREGNYKLTIYGDDKCELYDLASDPDELINLYDRVDYTEIKVDLTLKLLKRIMSVKVRDVGIEWNYERYMQDVRFEPLERATKLV